MDNVERLMEFGLTRHEASLYILLTLEGSLNGYEAAKQSGISRSNAYNALAGLVDKGAAYIQEEDTVRYTPVAIEEFCSNKIRHLEQKKTELIAELPDKRKNEGGYLTIKGEEHIAIRSLICCFVQKSVRISLYTMNDWRCFGNT